MNTVKRFIIVFIVLLHLSTVAMAQSVKDGLGRLVTIKSPPQKIVSTIPSNTEILYDLGLRDKVIAVTSHCKKTCDISGKCIIGGWSEPGIVEKIAELKPDLVLAFGGLQSPLVAEMDKRDIPTFVFFPGTVDEILEQIMSIGKITGTAKKAKDVIRENQKKLNEIERALRDIPLENRIKCLRLMSTEAMVIGGASFQNDIIKKAGGVNIFEDIKEGYPIVTLEEVEKKDPDIIVFNRDDEEKAIEWFLKQKGWQDLRAAKEGKLASTSCDYICHPNTRVAKTVEMLARHFYPARFPVVLKDATNKTIKFFEKPQRVISLNPSATETLYALTAKKDLIAVTQFCPFPDLLEEKENIGTVLEPDIEKIISLRPDLVFATLEGNRKTSIDNLRSSGINVFVLDGVRSFRDVYERIEVMGQALKRQRDADQLILSMNERIEQIKRKTEKKVPLKVFLQLGADPIVTANKDTVINEIIELAGGENIAKGASLKYPKYSLEAIVASNPDAIIIVSMGKFGESTLKKWLAYKNIKAIQNSKICIIDSNLICHMGPRLVDGIEKIAEFLYPEEFKIE